MKQTTMTLMMLAIVGIIMIIGQVKGEEEKIRREETGENKYSNKKIDFIKLGKQEGHITDDILNRLTPKERKEIDEFNAKLNKFIELGVPFTTPQQEKQKKQTIIVRPKNGRKVNDESGWGSCVKVHGNFCGPGYCGTQYWDGCKGRHVHQSRCNYNSGSYVDALDKCCRAHDKCCVEARSKSSCSHCRPSMVACLERISCSWSASCSVKKSSFLLFFRNRSGCC
mmetsp:Transcript_11466/g.16953  ORF Transcript_11466/g.16953 Transcript_11466/m.16953 type:complete len:225 (+) Transcript_11466:26-700(+)